MKRDMDIIRKIVFVLREADEIVVDVDGIDSFTFCFHAVLLVEAGLAIGDDAGASQMGMSAGPVPFAMRLLRLTWEGHDFADSIKDDTVWSKATEKLLGPGVSFTFEIMKTLIADEIKKRLQI